MTIHYPPKMPDPGPGGPGVPGDERPRAVTLQSIQIESRITTCGYCRGIHHIQKCPSLQRALHAEPWVGIDLGRGLCQMLWCNHADFVELLHSATPARLIEYAISYQTFLRDKKPDSDLTINDIVQAWTREMNDEPMPRIEVAA